MIITVYRVFSFMTFVQFFFSEVKIYHKTSDTLFAGCCYIILLRSNHESFKVLIEAAAQQPIAKCLWLNTQPQDVVNI